MKENNKMFILKRIEKKIDDLTKANISIKNNIQKNNLFFNDEIDRLCKLRLNIEISKSLVQLVSLLKDEPLLKERRLLKGVKARNEKERFYRVRARSLQYIDGMIAKRIIESYKTKCVYREGMSMDE